MRTLDRPIHRPFTKPSGETLPYDQLLHLLYTYMLCISSIRASELWGQIPGSTKLSRLLTAKGTRLSSQEERWVVHPVSSVRNALSDENVGAK